MDQHTFLDLRTKPLDMDPRLWVGAASALVGAQLAGTMRAESDVIRAIDFAKAMIAVASPELLPLTIAVVSPWLTTEHPPTAGDAVGMIRQAEAIAATLGADAQARFPKATHVTLEELVERHVNNELSQLRLHLAQVEVQLAAHGGCKNCDGCTPGDTSTEPAG